jgi:hypothetical protein
MASGIEFKLDLSEVENMVKTLSDIYPGRRKKRRCGWLMIWPLKYGIFSKMFFRTGDTQFGTRIFSRGRLLLKRPAWRILARAGTRGDM